MPWPMFMQRPCALRYTPGRGRYERGPAPCPPAPSRRRRCQGTDPYRRSELLGGHPRFDIGQGTIDAGEHPLLAHQRHRGVDAGGLTQIGDGNVRWQAYSAAMRASIYAKARSMRASTRSLPTSAITASIAGDWPRPVTATRSGMPTLPMP